MELDFKVIWLPCDSAGKESACNMGDLDLIPGLGRSPGEEKDYSLQYSGLENSMVCLVHGIPKGWTWWSDFHVHCLGLILNPLFSGCEMYKMYKLWNVSFQCCCFFVCKMIICISQVSPEKSCMLEKVGFSANNERRVPDNIPAL